METKTRIDMKSTPTKWVATFTRAEFEEVLKLEEETMQWVVQPDFGDTLQDKLSERNQACVLRFRKSEICQKGDDRYGSKQFFGGYGTCKGDSCTAKYSFAIKEEPMDIEAVSIIIK